MKDGTLPLEALLYFQAQGRLGGKIGGAKRAASMSPEERSATAKRMVTARIAKRAAIIAAGEIPPKRLRRDISDLNHLALGTPTLTCVRCGYRWITRTVKKPKQCPECSARSWDMSVEDALSARKPRIDAREPYPCPWCNDHISYTITACDGHIRVCRKREAKDLSEIYGIPHFNTAVYAGEIMDLPDAHRWVNLLGKYDLLPLLVPLPALTHEEYAVLHRIVRVTEFERALATLRASYATIQDVAK